MRIKHIERALRAIRQAKVGVNLEGIAKDKESFERWFDTWNMSNVEEIEAELKR